MPTTLDGELVEAAQRAFKREAIGQAFVNLAERSLTDEEAKKVEELIKEVEPGMNAAYCG